MRWQRPWYPPPQPKKKNTGRDTKKNYFFWSMIFGTDEWRLILSHVRLADGYRLSLTCTLLYRIFDDESKKNLALNTFCIAPYISLITLKKMLRRRKPRLNFLPDAAIEIETYKRRKLRRNDEARRLSEAHASFLKWEAARRDHVFAKNARLITWNGRS